MTHLSPAQFMMNTLRGNDDGMTIKKLKHSHICICESPIGKIYIECSGNALTPNEYAVLRLIINKAVLYAEKSNVHSIHLKNALNAFDFVAPGANLSSRLHGLMAQFDLQDAKNFIDHRAQHPISRKWLLNVTGKLTSMALEITYKNDSNKSTSFFSPLRDFIFIDKNCLAHVNEIFAYWVTESTSWDDVRRRYSERNWTDLMVKHA